MCGRSRFYMLDKSLSKRHFLHFKLLFTGAFLNKKTLSKMP
uniref:Uncharacterized protein n=1 Tax=Vibrio tasmaniensis TaxID=212663 RepID=A0A0H3ZU21_9VIBR|nr:hypothetical protein [Vibrio tasmaniensis]